MKCEFCQEEATRLSGDMYWCESHWNEACAKAESYAESMLEELYAD